MHGVTGCASIGVSPAEVVGAIEDVAWRSVAVDGVGDGFAAQVGRFTGATIPELERFGFGAVGHDGRFLLLALEGGYGAGGRERLYAVMTRAVMSSEGLTLVACDHDGPEAPELPGTVMATETVAGGWSYGVAQKALSHLRQGAGTRSRPSLSHGGGGLA